MVACHHGKTDHDSFAAILARFNQARAACLGAQTDASQEPASTTRTVTWFAGLSESAVPVYVGNHILGFLETGNSLTFPSFLALYFGRNFYTHFLYGSPKNRQTMANRS
jgi:hypothetical protein